MRVFVLGCAIVALSLCACDADDGLDESGAVDEGEQIETGADTGEYDRSSEWPDDADRIVSMAPNVTEILFALGLGDRVVAVSRYCDWPEETDELDTVGGVLDPDYEAILGADPDVVVGVTEGVDPDLQKNLADAGVAYGFVSIEGLDSVRRGIERLGDWFGVGDRGRQLVSDFDADLDAASGRVGRAVDSEAPTALMIVDREPLVVAGPDSFGDQLLESAGLQNAVDGDSGPYPVLDVEHLYGLDPELIVDVKIDADDSASHRYWEQFDALDAVDGGRVYHIDDPVMMRPGPRVPVAVERLAEAIETP